MANLVAGLNNRAGKPNYQNLPEGLECAPLNDLFVVNCSRLKDILNLCTIRFTFEDQPKGCFAPIIPNTSGKMCDINNMKIPPKDKCKRQIIDVGINGGFNNVEELRENLCIKNDGNYYPVKGLPNKINSKGGQQNSR